MYDIFICHKTWNDNLEINNNIITRKNENKDSGKCYFNNDLLYIIWEKWNSELFCKKDNKYYLVDNYNYIPFYDNNTENIYNDVLYINYNFKLYNCNLEYIGEINENNKNIIIKLNNKQKEYIYFNFKYYEKKYFDNHYKIIKLYCNDFINQEYFNQILNKKIILDLKDEYIYNFLKKTDFKYIIYKNKIKIYNSNIHFYFKTNNNYKYYLYNDFINFKNIQDFNLNNCYIFLNFYNKLNNKTLLNIIEYYNYFNINILVIENYNNINNNILYDNNNVYYIKNINEIYSIIKKYNIKKLYINNENKEKYNINDFENVDIIFYEDDLIYNNYYFIDNYNMINIQNIWSNINIQSEHIQYLLNYNKDNNNIPKIIHFIWLGKNQIPDIYIQYIKTWIQNHKDYLFCLWNDDNIPNLINQKYYDNSTEYAMKADILRYELLYFIGGIYIDCDFLCFKNIDPLINHLDAFSAYESNKYIAIGIMGFKKYNYLLENIIKQLSYNILAFNNTKNIPYWTGPVFFTNMWNLYKQNNHYLFPINYFYSYSFNDKINKLKYKISKNNYAIHMWGHSWKDCKEDIFINNLNYTDYLYLSNIIYPFDKKLNKNICYKYNYQQNIFKIKIVHIMGLFFTGGIERYLYYIDKYGNHDKYEYYIICIKNNDNYAYKINNIKIISYKYLDLNHYHFFINKILHIINPFLIIDHYSIYINNNSILYKGINKNNIIYFIHSAICYNNNIENLNIKKAIHLYNEINKEPSWNNINKNYYITLGTELNNYENINNINNKLYVSIIGRITEEKIPMYFLKKLCNLSLDNKFNQYIELHIYGEKDIEFNNDYVIKFEKLIKNSNIIVHNFEKDIHNIYKKTNLILIPSIYETGSFTCIEAFSFGLPVISKNVYGLKYLIENGINGYLCDNDDDMLFKLKNIMNDPILNNHLSIKKISLQYNIINKIKDLENIIDENIISEYDWKNLKNCIIITSVLNCSNKCLSYYHTRSIFSIEERYKQTLNTIDSIYKYIPNCEILFCECSDLSNHLYIENEIKNKCTYYYNFYSNKNILKHVESPYKGLGETSLILKCIEILKNKNYKYLFKISGRYYLNEKFKYDDYNNNYNIFSYWDNSIESFCTIFYKINFNDIFLFENILFDCINDLENLESIEKCMWKYFNKNIYILNNLNVSGLLSTEGYLVNV
jgi:mannosyltransferase OCH1-like enzyme/glycosyltransferase involved in cell wall biosynthesis